jgi:ankyrin repeat protein
VAVRLCRWTALHWALFNGRMETAMALVKAGADVHCKAKDGYGSSRLHRIFRHCVPKGSEGTGAAG